MFFFYLSTLVFFCKKRYILQLCDSILYAAEIDIFLKSLFFVSKRGKCTQKLRNPNISGDGRGQILLKITKIALKLKKTVKDALFYHKKFKIKKYSLDEQFGFQSQLILIPRTILYITALADFGVLFLKPILVSGTLCRAFEYVFFCRLI